MCEFPRLSSLEQRQSTTQKNCPTVSWRQCFFIALWYFSKELRRGSISHNPSNESCWTCNLDRWLVAMAKAWHPWKDYKTMGPWQSMWNNQHPSYMGARHSRHKIVTSDTDTFCAPVVILHLFEVACPLCIGFQSHCSQSCVCLWSFRLSS